jgi:hypothetical protein
MPSRNTNQVRSEISLPITKKPEKHDYYYIDQQNNVELESLKSKLVADSVYVDSKTLQSGVSFPSDFLQNSPNK